MVKLTQREEVADRTMAFHFEKPEGFLYKAGQFADFTLIDPPETDAEGNIRGFSLASAPWMRRAPDMRACSALIRSSQRDAA
jgi:ferredoxin-NADP reductase